MRDLIDRKAAIEVADAVWCVTGDKNVAKVWDQIRGLPAVDAVPVIRCKDCKRAYCREYPNWQEPIYTCTHFSSRWNTDFDMEVNPDDYCSRAKRRTDG